MSKPKRPPFKMKFDIGTIKHLGLQMYSTLPPVIGELVSNAWDADASVVSITIPTTPLTSKSEIVIEDDGMGMSDIDIREAYMIVGRDRRKECGDTNTQKGRKVMGRKGIGKFSAFGIAGTIEIETVCDGEPSRFEMSMEEFERNKVNRELEMPVLPATGKVKKGTRITLRNFSKFRNKSISIDTLRRALARRFSVISEKNFRLEVNGKPITPSERDLQKLLDTDVEGKKYLWKVENEEIMPNTGWVVNGWIGALNRTAEVADGIQRGIVIMARGKLVQEPWVFDATVGQQFALSYIVGELHAEFVDEAEDTIATTRNSLVWDTEANAAFKKWGQEKVNRIARAWAERRSEDNEKDLIENPIYKKFKEDTERHEGQATWRVADKLIREIVKKNPMATLEDQLPVVQICMDFVEFDAFKELAEEMGRAEIADIPKLIGLFRDWEVIEAKEMMRVTEGRIKTIEKLQDLIDTNALEVPTLHNFLKEFPWVLDPRWSLIADETTYSQLLRSEFPEPTDTLEENKRIDFLCVGEANNLVVVEIKRPGCKVSLKELAQIEAYVGFMREHVMKSTDPHMSYKTVIGYLLCGESVDTGAVRQRRENLERSNIFIRRYVELLSMVEKSHREFLQRYAALQKAKKRGVSDPKVSKSVPTPPKKPATAPPKPGRPGKK